MVFVVFSLNITKKAVKKLYVKSIIVLTEYTVDP